MIYEHLLYVTIYQIAILMDSILVSIFDFWWMMHSFLILNQPVLASALRAERA